MVFRGFMLVLAAALLLLTAAAGVALADAQEGDTHIHTEPWSNDLVLRTDHSDVLFVDELTDDMTFYSHELSSDWLGYLYQVI